MKKLRNKNSKLLENLSLILLGILLLVFPLIFSALTTDVFGLPKQIILGVVALASLLFVGFRMITEGEIQLRNTPFDIPLLIFTVVVLISGVISLDRSDALTAFFPFLFGVIIYFVVVNTAKTENNVLFLLGALVLGGCLNSIFQILTYFNIYILPAQYTHTRTFTPMGSLLDQAIYLGLLLPMVIYLTYTIALPLFNKRSHNNDSGNTTRFLCFLLSSIILIGGFVVTLVTLLTLQKPLILPFSTGFQTGFAAISQDTTRVVQSFLFGSGFGTYILDFTRFKSQAYNSDPNLWSFTFFRSSSFLLELLATTGVVGLLSYLYLSFKIVKDRPAKHEGGFGVFLSLILAIIASFVLPYSFIPLTLLFIILAIFSSIQGLAHPERVYDLSLKLRGVFKGGKIFTSEQEKSYDRALPILFIIPLIVLAAVLVFFSYKYVVSDMTFENSLAAEQQNNGLLTYNLQNRAINLFPYRDAYYRIFSQTNLAIANSIALQQPRGKKLNSQTQQTIYTLVQQSINSGRSAVSLSPENTLDWQNLSSVYRSLIGFGQNAGNFAIAANQQAIALDQNNPQEYINLGGIYYQLAQWDQAANEFSIAISLKPDYANAHYNLGHAFEQKGDYSDALTQYKIVQQLVINDPVNSKTIASDIAAVESKQKAISSKNSSVKSSSTNQPPLGLNTPPAQLPARNPKATIPGPGVSPEPTKTQTSPTPTQSKATPTPQAPTPAP